MAKRSLLTGFTGRQPKASPVLLDTVVDQDASADDKDKVSAQSTIPGATSRDVYGGLGVPIQGMSSNEQRHDGRPGRKRQGGGVEQFGEGHDEDANEQRGVTGKIAFREC